MRHFAIGARQEGIGRSIALSVLMTHGHDHTRRRFSRSNPNREQHRWKRYGEADVCSDPARPGARAGLSCDK